MDMFGDILKRYFVGQWQELDERLTMREMLAQMRAQDPERFSLVLKQMLMAGVNDAEGIGAARAAYIAECRLRDGVDVERVLLPGLPQPCETFDRFMVRPAYPAAMEAYKAARDWALGVGPCVLVLTGPPGVGKTHLAQAAALEVSRRRDAPWLLYREEPALKGMLLGLAGDPIRLDAVVAEVCEAQWLVLDDLGVATPTEWWQEMLDRIINLRWGRFANRTLITTNMVAGKMSPRMGSRLRDVNRTLAVVIKAADYRQHPE